MRWWRHFLTLRFFAEYWQWDVCSLTIQWKRVMGQGFSGMCTLVSGQSFMNTALLEQPWKCLSSDMISVLILGKMDFKDFKIATPANQACSAFLRGDAFWVSAQRPEDKLSTVYELPGARCPQSSPRWLHLYWFHWTEPKCLTAMNIGESLLQRCQPSLMRYLTRNWCKNQCLSLTAGGRSLRCGEMTKIHCDLKATPKHWQESLSFRREWLQSKQRLPSTWKDTSENLMKTSLENVLGSAQALIW